MINFSKITTWLSILLIVFLFVAGVFAYQWWQAKGELGKEIKRNEILMKQIEVLQKQIKELKSAEEEVTDETADWKTYRNEEYGFEIDYLVGGVDGWMFYGEEWKQQVRSILFGASNKSEFGFEGTIEFFDVNCHNPPDWSKLVENFYDCSLLAEM